jgi:hypothetical protein
MRVFTRLITILALLAIPAVAGASEELTKRDARGPVTVVATLMPAAAAGEPLRVKIALDTHSVGLDTIALDRTVTLRKPDGSEVAPTSVEAMGSGHHRSAVVVFPALPSSTPVTIVVKAVGGVAERVFTWEAGR